MIFYHDTRSEQFRFPCGAAPCGSKVRLRVRASGLKAVTLRIWWENSEYRWFMAAYSSDLYEYEMTIPGKPGMLWYYFTGIDESGTVWYLGNADDELGGIGTVKDHEPASFRITVYDRAFQTPEWMRNGMMMQIMVDRFANAGGKDIRNLPEGSYYHVRWDDDPALVLNDRFGTLCSNDYFGGNLRGIQEKLDYISSMGVTVLYLNPIFKANSNHKYNTGDYMQIDPTFGTEEDFKSLCKAAEKKGIRIVLDGVFSHTGADSVYFDRAGTYGGKGAYCDPKSPYASWYKFERWPDKYESWWGINTLPNVREEEPSYRKFIISAKDSVQAHWMKAGACGWRLDVADELPMEFLREFRTWEKKRNPDAALIGEVWEDPTNKVAYGEVRNYCTGDTLDSAMNYPLRDMLLDFMRYRINAHTFARRMDFMRENQPKVFFYSEMNLLSSHDRPRALAILADIGNMEPERKYRFPIELNEADYNRGKKRLIAAWRLLCALPGMPCIYYGDEAGLYGMTDPYSRGTYPWGREDTEILEAFRASSLTRMKSAVLKTGDMRLSAVGEDIILVERFIVNKKDVFGNTQKNAHAAFALNRSDEIRWIEYKGKTVQLAPQSTTELL